VYNEGESEEAALQLQTLTWVEKERLRAAVRIYIGYLLDNAPHKRQNEKQKKVESEKATELQAEQLRLKLRSRRPRARASAHAKGLPYAIPFPLPKIKTSIILLISCPKVILKQPMCNNLPILSS
jgi:hypothetical protein